MPDPNGETYPCMAKFIFKPSDGPDNIWGIGIGMEEAVADELLGRGTTLFKSPGWNWRLYFGIEHIDGEAEELAHSTELFHNAIGRLGLTSTVVIDQGFTVCQVRNPDADTFRRQRERQARLIADNVVELFPGNTNFSE